MPDKQNHISQRDDKDWIKPGVAVAHRDYPDRKMIVDDILKRVETIKDGDKEVDKTFTIGIECHWFLDDGGYARGRFLTMELIKFGSKRKKTDPGSFPDTIPSSPTNS
jgi:hypothetical protein